MTKTIVIDPGHVSYEQGAIAIDGIPEKDFNLPLGLALRTALEAYDCRVIMTREEDHPRTPGVSLAGDLAMRAAIANQNNANLLVSLHHDASENPYTQGGSAYVWTDKRNPKGGLVWLPAEGNHDAPNSYQIAQQIYPVVAKALAGFGIPWRGKVMCAGFQVLGDTAGPAILLEAFFGSSPQDVAAARRPEFIPTLAKALAEGIARALDIPLKEKAIWDPVAEITQTMEAGLIDSPKEPNQQVTWGELSTVLNRVNARIEGRGPVG